jgi:hypothetical protein
MKQLFVTNETEAQEAVDQLLQCAVLKEADQILYPRAVWRYHIGGDGYE